MPTKLKDYSPYFPLDESDYAGLPQLGLGDWLNWGAQKTSTEGPTPGPQFKFGKTGEFLSENAGGIGLGAGMAGSLIDMIDARDGETSVGASSLSGALKGAGAGMMFGPLGAIAGAGLGLVGGLISGRRRKEAEEEALAAKQEQQDLLDKYRKKVEFSGQYEQFMSDLEPSIQYAPTIAEYGGDLLGQYCRGGKLPRKRFGGPIEITGQSHSGAQGGVPTDAEGNPSVISGRPPVALTEDGEVTFYGYVFSDKLIYNG